MKILMSGGMGLLGKKLKQIEPTIISTNRNEMNISHYDDIVNQENSRTQTGRQALSEKYWMSFDPMLLPKGQQAVVGTRYHYEDLYAEFIPKFDTEKKYKELYTGSEEVEALTLLQ